LLVGSDYTSVVSDQDVQYTKCTLITTTVEVGENELPLILKSWLREQKKAEINDQPSRGRHWTAVINIVKPKTPKGRGKTGQD
jgi:hypothetical protein